MTAHLLQRPIGALIFALPWLLQPAAALEYEKDIMPVLMAKCADCHSAQAEKLKGGLRFDDPEHFHKRFAKNDVVIPGDWDASYLFVTIFRPPEDEEAMPPKGEGERLTVEEIILVLEWIAEGAPINGTRGERGAKPANYDELFLDLGGPPAPPPAGQKAAEEQWTNREGVTITAALIRVEGDVALLRTANGAVHRYPIDKLSEESLAKLKNRESGAQP